MMKGSEVAVWLSTLNVERENYSRINIKGWRWKRSFHITNELRK